MWNLNRKEPYASSGERKEKSSPSVTACFLIISKNYKVQMWSNILTQIFSYHFFPLDTKICNSQLTEFFRLALTTSFQGVDELGFIYWSGDHESHEGTKIQSSMFPASRIINVERLVNWLSKKNSQHECLASCCDRQKAFHRNDAW